MVGAGGVSASSVLLGVVDQEIRSQNTSFRVNKIGGFADFTSDLEGSTKCSSCGALQLLVAQVYCPLDSSMYHRTLYLFSCEKPACWSRSCGWTALRQILFDESYESKAKSSAKSSASQTWDGGENDWGDEFDGESGPSSEPAQQFNEDVENVMCQTLEKMSLVKSSAENQSEYGAILSPLELICKNEDTCTSFKSFYINVFDETYSNSELNSVLDKDGCREKKISVVVENESLSKFANGCKIVPEEYEPSPLSDQTFHKFWKCISKFPEQAIRYSVNGSAILAKDMQEDVPHCSCGSPRMFEMQLMPALIPFLKMKDVSIEFSTVVVYTCASNCALSADNSLTSEFVVYQDDPDLAYFKGQKK